MKEIIFEAKPATIIPADDLTWRDKPIVRFLNQFDAIADRLYGLAYELAEEKNRSLGAITQQGITYEDYFTEYVTKFNSLLAEISSLANVKIVEKPIDNSTNL